MRQSPAPAGPTAETITLASIYARFAALVHGIALARVGPDEADDVVQEVFVKVATRLATLRDPAALPGWITVLARHAAVDRLRARRRAPAADAAALAALPARPGPADDGVLRARVLALLGRLPEAYREALVLRLVEGLDGPRIAALTGMTPGSVRVHLHRGMEQLRPLLRAEGWA